MAKKNKKNGPSSSNYYSEEEKKFRDAVSEHLERLGGSRKKGAHLKPEDAWAIFLKLGYSKEGSLRDKDSDEQKFIKQASPYNMGVRRHYISLSEMLKIMNDLGYGVFEKEAGTEINDQDGGEKRTIS